MTLIEKLKRLFKKYNTRDLFNKKLKTLRGFQLDAFNKTKGDKNKNGQIFLPTGTGKTLIQLAIHVDDMITKSEKNEYGVYVIAAHRLVLCNQLFKEFKSFMNDCGLSASYLYIGSEEEGKDFKTTLDSDLILEEAEKAQKDKKHLVIVSTYNSFNKLGSLDCIDVCTYDEAHKSVRIDFIKNILDVKYKIKRNYFFTATQKEIDDTDLNDSLFGDVLYEKFPPAVAIKKKEIVPPYIHEIKIDVSDEQDKQIENSVNMLFKVITTAFIKHKEAITESSRGILGAKILISADGLKQVHAFNELEKFKTWCISRNINHFSFSSCEGEYVNFLRKTRQSTLENLRDLNNHKDAIIFHHNIVSEGIDLPNLTGVLILRNLNLITFTQTVGRSCRLLKEDRIKLYNNTENYNMIKPNSWVLIPDCEGVNPTLLSTLTEFLRTTYEIPKDICKLDNSSGGGGNGSKPRKLDEGSDKQELKHILENYGKTIEFDLDQLFNAAEDKEKFLLDLIDEVYPDEDDKTNIETLPEGAEAIYKEGVYFKRNPKLRELCLEKYGCNCYVCNTNLKNIYGIANDTIEVHHEDEHSLFKEEHEVRINRLKPVCPTCHATIHKKRNPCYTIEEVKTMLRENK